MSDYEKTEKLGLLELLKGRYCDKKGGLVVFIKD